MHATITINTKSLIPSATLPAFLSDHLLYGSRCFYFSERFGYLLAQSLDASPYSLLYTISKTEEDTSIRMSCLNIGFVCHFTFDKSMSAASAQTGSIRLQAQSLMLVSSPAWVVTANLKENENYKSLTLMFPSSIVLERLRLFPLLDKLKADIQQAKPFYLPGAIYPLSVHLTHMLAQLLQVPYTFLSKEFYHSLLVSVLSEIFAHMQSGSFGQAPFTFTDIDSVASVKRWIDTHLDTHFTIGQLARKAGINEFKLKKAFKQMYGTGLYGYLLQQRLNIARINLEQTTRPIAQVARQAGYKSTANFSTAFRRQYGITPNRFRRQNRPQ